MWFEWKRKLMFGATALLATGSLAAYQLWGDAKSHPSVRSVDTGKLIPPNGAFVDYFVNSRRLWIHFREWKIPDPKAIVFIIHGLGEHIGRYEHIARDFNTAGFSVFGMDNHGAGLSDGTVKHAERFSHFCEDYQQFISLISERQTNGSEKALPKFIFGHSMGGAIALKVATSLNGTFAGAIISAAALKPDPSSTSPAAIALLKIISSLLPKMRVQSLDMNLLCRDPLVMQRAMADPLFSKKMITARLACEIIETMDWLNARAQEVEFPYMMFTGTDDGICLPSGTYEFHERTGSTDKTLKRYDGAFHEAFHGPYREKIINDMVEWIYKRI